MVDGGPNSGGLELGQQPLGVGPHLVGDGQQAHLFGRQPEGEIAGVVLGHDPEEAL